jgi:hypothetical protein
MMVRNHLGKPQDFGLSGLELGLEIVFRHGLRLRDTTVFDKAPRIFDEPLDDIDSADVPTWSRGRVKL